MSLNCFGSPLSLNRGTRFELIRKIIAEVNPDIFAGQEIFFQKNFEEITKAGKDLGYFVFPEKTEGLNPGGLLTLSRFPISFQRSHLFNRQSGWLPIRSAIERASKRRFDLLQIELKGSRMFFINTHLSDLWPGGVEKNRLIQEQINEIINEMAKLPKDEKLILVGDFNFTPASTHYKNLIKDGEFFDPLGKTDTLTVSSENTNRNFLMQIFGKPGVIDERVDYALFRNFIRKPITQKVILQEPILFRRKKIYASDHYGLLSKAEL